MNAGYLRKGILSGSFTSELPLSPYGRWQRTNLATYTGSADWRKRAEQDGLKRYQARDTKTGRSSQDAVISPVFLDDQSDADTMGL
ncbi:hypothetical protein ACOMHN_051112 [Nucella lapillus]